MERSRDSKPEAGPADTKGFVPLFIAAQVFAVASVVLVIVWSSRHLGGYDWSNAGTRFNWHPTLMVVGFVFLYGNGMLVYRLMRDEPKPRLKLIHAGLNGLAFVLAVVALIAVFSFHNEKNIPNMYSLHSWIGLGTVILFGLNLVGGGVFFLLPQTPDNLRSLILPFHVFGGQAALALITITIVSGCTEKLLFKFLDASYVKSGKPGYGALPPEAYIMNFLGISVVAFSLIVAYTVTRSEYKRRPLSAEVPIRLAMEESSH